MALRAVSQTFSPNDVGGYDAFGSFFGRSTASITGGFERENVFATFSTAAVANYAQSLISPSVILNYTLSNINYANNQDIVVDINYPKDQSALKSNTPNNSGDVGQSDADIFYQARAGYFLRDVNVKGGSVSRSDNVTQYFNDSSGDTLVTFHTNDDLITRLSDINVTVTGLQVFNLPIVFGGITQFARTGQAIKPFQSLGLLDPSNPSGYGDLLTISVQNSSNQTDPTLGTLSLPGNPTALTDLGNGSYRIGSSLRQDYVSTSVLQSELNSIVYTPKSFVRTSFSILYSSFPDAINGTSTNFGGSILFSTPSGSASPSGVGSGASPSSDSSVPTISTDTVSTVFRFFNQSTGEEFLTSDNTEAGSLLNANPTLVSEGIGFQSVVPNSNDASVVPVYRFFDLNSGNHFFTENGSERDSLVTARPDLSYEGVAFYEHATQEGGTTAVYRFFESTTGGHFYTGSLDERNSILNTRPDLVAEGIAFYAPIT